MNQFAFLTIPNTDGQYHVRLSYMKQSSKLNLVVTGPSITTIAEISLETGEFVNLQPKPLVHIEVLGGVAYNETPEGVPVEVNIKDLDTEDYDDDEELDEELDEETTWDRPLSEHEQEYDDNL